MLIGNSLNKIINGCMRIAQRGTSFATVANGAYTLDRWCYEKNGAMVHTITQDTDVPTNQGFYYSLKLDCTTVDSSIAAGDYCFIIQIIEGYNYAPLVNKTCTLSFWVKATKTGTYCISFRNAANSTSSDRSYVVEYTINTTNTWEYKNIRVKFDSNTGNWNYVNGKGLEVLFTLAAGSNFQTTANAWQTGNYKGTSSQVNACDSTDNNFWITGVQLTEGSSSLPFQHRLMGLEMRLCCRYFFKAIPHLTGIVLTSGAKGNPGDRISRAGCNYPVPMRIAPTITTAGALNFWDGGANIAFTASAWYIGTIGFDSDWTAASGSLTYQRQCCFNMNGASAWSFSAEF